MPDSHKSSRFPQGDDRRIAHEETERQTKRLIERFKENPQIIFDRYFWLDTDLDYKGGSSLSYYETFHDLLPEGTKLLKDYIEEVLKERWGDALFADFGGVGSNIAKAFTPGFFKRSFGVALFDERFRPSTEWRTEEIRAADAALNHTVIEGDLRDPDLYEHLREELEGEKLDLLIERMGKGLEFSPTDTKTVGALLQTWYDLVREGGLMLIQIPIHFNIFIQAWVEKVQRETGGTLEIKCAIGDSDAGTDAQSVLLIHKQPGAPAKLPMLTAAEVGNLIEHDRKK
ncbi:MAG: hypothetical protein AAB440_01985 [Patescibacteria group bacterium]